MTRNHETVPTAWAVDREAASGALRTDGRTLWSYNSVIGYTSGIEKIAIRCRYSTTTSRHANGAVAVADSHERCTAHASCR